MAIHRFTTATARDFAAKGNAVRWSQPRTPQPPKDITTTTKPVSQGIAIDPYLETRKVRVRKLLDWIDAEIKTELSKERFDSKRVKELVDAQEGLAEQERRASGRSLPPTQKPLLAKPGRKLEPQAEPTVSEPDSTQEPNG